jgi:hypothetical protein
VIYGDTDSVMVNFHCGTGPDALPRALEMGMKASKAVTSEFKAPNELEFEKVKSGLYLYWALRSSKSQTVFFLPWTKKIRGF